MIKSLVELAQERGTLRDTALTLASVGISAATATILGILIALILFCFPRLRTACEPYIASYYALPLFALYPVMVVVLGVGAAPIIFTGVLYAVMSVVITTLTGLDHVPRVLHKVSKAHRLNAWETAIRVLIPCCAGEIIAGVTLCVSYAFVAVIASEFLLASAGLGHAIAEAYTQFRVERMYGLMLGLLVLVMAVNIGLKHLRIHLGQEAL